VGFEVQVIETPRGHVVRLRGEATVDAQPRLSVVLAQLLAACLVRVVFDLNGLTVLSGAVLKALLAFRLGMAELAGEVKLAGLPVTVSDSVRRARVERFFEIVATVDEALGLSGDVTTACVGRRVPPKPRATES
jgi:anti-anti-sigma regulatory factor